MKCEYLEKEDCNLCSVKKECKFWIKYDEFLKEVYEGRGQ